MVGLAQDQLDQDGEAPTVSTQSIDFTVRTEFLNPNIVRMEGVKIKNGPNVLKEAILWFIGKQETGEIKRTRLTVDTYPRIPGTKTFAKEPSAHWSAEGDEITQLQVLLNRELIETGKYQAISGDDSVNDLLQKISSGVVDTAVLLPLVDALADSDEAQAVLAKEPSATVLADAVNLYRQREAIEVVAKLVENPTTLEGAIQAELQKQWWMFGGRYIDIAKRRTFVVLDQLDIPLIRGDGSLHAVELKRANVPKLIKKYRSHLIVGDEVNEAVGQAVNYLTSLDEERDHILAKLGVDVRRASVTVVIGHTDFVTDFTPHEVHETLRTYNSHLARIEVITFDELVDGARQSLSLST